MNSCESKPMSFGNNRFQVLQNGSTMMKKELIGILTMMEIIGIQPRMVSLCGRRMKRNLTNLKLVQKHTMTKRMMAMKMMYNSSKYSARNISKDNKSTHLFMSMAKTRIFGVILLTATLLLAGCTEAEDDGVPPEDTPTLQIYNFEGSDSSTSVSSNSGEDLADVMMEVGAEILWDEVVVTIMVDESAPYVCSTDSNDESACHYETNQQAYWSVGDSITIKEGNDDLCSSICTLDITINKQSDGSEHVIDNMDVNVE